MSKEKFTTTEVPLVWNYFNRSVVSYAFKENELCRHTLKHQGMPIEILTIPIMHIEKIDGDKDWKVIIQCPICNSRYRKTENELSKHLDEMMGFQLEEGNDAIQE